LGRKIGKTQKNRPSVLRKIGTTQKNRPSVLLCVGNYPCFYGLNSANI